MSALARSAEAPISSASFMMGVEITLKWGTREALAENDFAGGAVQGDEIPLPEHMRPNGHDLRRFLDLDRGPPATQRFPMPRATARRGRSSLPAVRIPWAACIPPCPPGRFRCKPRPPFPGGRLSRRLPPVNDLSDHGAGRSRKPLADDLDLGLRVEDGSVTLFELLRIDPHDGRTSCRSALPRTMSISDLQEPHRSVSRPGLQHVELAVLDR